MITDIELRCNGCGKPMQITNCNKCGIDNLFCYHCHNVNHPLTTRMKYGHLLNLGLTLTALFSIGGLIIIA